MGLGVPHTMVVFINENLFVAVFLVIGPTCVHIECTGGFPVGYHSIFNRQALRVVLRTLAGMVCGWL